MKKYLFVTFVYFLLPLAIIAVIAEYSLRKIPNDYAYKNQWLTENSKDVEVLALGASSVFYDINPEYLQRKGFNAAHVSQSLKYDNMIFNKFIDKMPSLSYVIMGIDFWSPFGTIEDSPEWWRVKYYNIHYGSNFYRWQGKYNYELYFHNLSTFKNATKGFLNLLGLKNESYRTVNDAGYGVNYSLNNRPDQWDNGEMEAKRHNEMISDSFNPAYIEENKRYMEDIIKKSADKNIKVILLNVPLYKSYRDNRDKEFLKMKSDFCDYFVQKYDNVAVLDFSHDARFTEDDFYDANHLNDNGTHKFTLMLDSIMNGDDHFEEELLADSIYILTND